MAVLLLLGGCGLSDVEIPGLDGTGPSTHTPNLLLTASPDYVRANGRDQSIIDVLLLGPTGEPMGGEEVAVVLSDANGDFHDIGVLNRERVRTDASGRARVRYTAPLRHEYQSSFTSVLVIGRPLGTDAAAARYRSVEIEIRSVEVNYPQNPNNSTPACSFIFTPPAGPYYVHDSIHFESTSTDAEANITEYYWDFGDEGNPSRTSDLPATHHAYSEPGLYEVLHVVTDAYGGRDYCPLVEFEILPRP